MPPSLSLPNSGGALSPNQINMTLDQRRAYNRLRALGIADAVAAQLAVLQGVAKAEQPVPSGLELAKAAMARVALRKKSYHEAFVSSAKSMLHPDDFARIHTVARSTAGGHASGEARRAKAEATADSPVAYPLYEDEDAQDAKVVKAEGATPPEGVRTACRRGLELMGEHGGPGLTEGAKARARSMASGDAVSPDNIKRMKAFFARHTEEKTSSPPSPGYVAWLLWGGDAGKTWATSQAEKLEKGKKPLGAAYARAKATGKDQSKEARKRRANKWLKENGHDTIGKAMGPLPQEAGLPEEQPPKKKKKKKLGKSGAAPEQVALSLETRIVKAEQQPWQNLVYSVVYAPDDLDTDGDYMDAATIEKAAHEAMAQGIYINHEHQGDPIGAHVVESYIAPCQMNLGGPEGEQTIIEKGTWMMAMKVTDPGVWASVIDGTYGGFSLEGSALAQVQQHAA